MVIPLVIVWKCEGMSMNFIRRWSSSRTFW